MIPCGNSDSNASCDSNVTVLRIKDSGRNEGFFESLRLCKNPSLVNLVVTIGDDENLQYLNQGEAFLLPLIAWDSLSECSTLNEEMNDFEEKEKLDDCYISKTPSMVNLVIVVENEKVVESQFLGGKEQGDMVLMPLFAWDTSTISDSSSSDGKVKFRKRLRLLQHPEAGPKEVEYEKKKKLQKKKKLSLDLSKRLIDKENGSLVNLAIVVGEEQNPPPEEQGDNPLVPLYAWDSISLSSSSEEEKIKYKKKNKTDEEIKSRNETLSVSTSSSVIKKENSLKSLFKMCFPFWFKKH